MQSMNQQDALVVGGVDAHADFHHAAALDQRGTLLATKQFATTTPGYAQLLEWLRAFGEITVVAVESTGSYAAGLVRYLREHDVQVFEVNQPHEHTRRRRGKSDAIDAEMAARLALAGKATAIPKQTDGIVEAIRLLRVARESAVKSRSAATVQLGGLIITAPQELRDQLARRKTLRGKAALCRRWRPATHELVRPADAAKFALRSLARRISVLDEEIAQLDRQLDEIVRIAAPRTIGLLGISTGHAGRLLVSAGENIDRLHSETSFAALCGASQSPHPPARRPDTASTTAATCQANRTLHLIAVCGLRHCHRTRAYAQRRTAEGKTKRDIIRCLKRYIAREVYNTLRADLADHTTRTPPPQITTIICGAGPIGITRQHP